MLVLDNKLGSPDVKILLWLSHEDFNVDYDLDHVENIRNDAPIRVRILRVN